MDEYKINNVYKDELGNSNGVFLYNKPAGITSHDVVYKFRRHLATKKVGHAGTLDPFATGLLIILVGKATKLSDQFLGLNKEYTARILFGLETNTGDPEGDIVDSIDNNKELTKELLIEAIESFKKLYIQSVPLFSSVKVKGKKLREMARSYHHYKLTKSDDSVVVNFYDDLNNSVKTVNIPSKEVKIFNADVLNADYISKNELINIFNNSYSKKDVNQELLKLDKYFYLDLKLNVSKGTYIRQFAMDLGKRLGVPAMLIGLTRNSIGEYKLDNVYNVD